MSLAKLWPYFHKGGLKNATQHHAYCKGCVSFHLAQLEANAEVIEEELDAAAKLERKEAFHLEGMSPISHYSNR